MTALARFGEVLPFLCAPKCSGGRMEVPLDPMNKTRIKTRLQPIRSEKRKQILSPGRHRKCYFFLVS